MLRSRIRPLPYPRRPPYPAAAILELFRTIPEYERRGFVHFEEIHSRKKPNDAVNKFKLKFLNATLDSINNLIKEYRPFPDFFDVDSLPSNSDVVVILSQYAGAVLRFRTENTSSEHGVMKGKPSDLIAGYPHKFKYQPK